MKRIIGGGTVFCLIVVGCGPKSSPAENNTHGDLACEEAAEEYTELYDNFPRDCEVYSDCVWFDRLANCGCPGIGNAQAEPEPVRNAEGEVAAVCGESSGVRGVGTCLNSVMCEYEPHDIGGQQALACEQRTCVAVKAVVSSGTIEPSTITVADTALTDQFFTLTIETEGLIDIDASATEAWLRVGTDEVEADIDTASVQGGTITLIIPYSWAEGLAAGQYLIGVSVTAGNATTGTFVTAITIEP